MVKMVKDPQLYSCKGTLKHVVEALKTKSVSTINILTLENILQENKCFIL